MVVAIGHGRDAFDRAKAALAAWKHFEVSWVEVLPRTPSFSLGTVVAILIRHYGFWSLNGCRVVYGLGDRSHGPTFGFAYGTLANHAERGEEIFEVSHRPDTDEVVYRIRAASQPRALGPSGIPARSLSPGAVPQGFGRRHAPGPRAPGALTGARIADRNRLQSSARGGPERRYGRS
jgi:uncharacterized protein (UPF0548 family)